MDERPLPPFNPELEAYIFKFAVAMGLFAVFIGLVTAAPIAQA